MTARSARFGVDVALRAPREAYPASGDIVRRLMAHEKIDCDFAGVRAWIRRVQRLPGYVGMPGIAPVACRPGGAGCAPGAGLQCVSNLYVAGPTCRG